MDTDSSDDQYSHNEEEEVDIFQDQSDKEQDGGGFSEESHSEQESDSSEDQSSDSGSINIDDGSSDDETGSKNVQSAETDRTEEQRLTRQCHGNSKESSDNAEGKDDSSIEDKGQQLLGLSQSGTQTPCPGERDDCQVVVPDQSTTDYVRSIGGTESTNTTHIAKPASGEQALDVVAAILKTADKASFDTTIETKGASNTYMTEVHVNLTQTNIHSPTAVTVGGQVVVNPPRKNKNRKKKEADKVPPTQLQKKRREIENRIEQWTEGMVHTRGTQAVLDKISQGKTLITITGSPGEGKTTTGYLVLKSLCSMGRQVYDIVTPDDYFKAKETRQPVLMMNDIFGSSTYDLDKRWKEVLSDILAMNEHKRDDERASRDRQKPQLTVLLISRASVLKEASYHLGRLKELILNEECIVDLTHGFETIAEERMKIWKYHSDKYNITIDEKTVKEVCQKSSQHGFPHCCRLFASMYAKNKLCDMKAFFSKPLEFLNQTMESMIMDKDTGPLLRELLRNNGVLDLDSVTDDEIRFQYSSVVDTLRGTYLSQDSDTVSFHHPSVYDSAAFIVCMKDPLFVIKNCSLSFLNERVRFDGLEVGNTRQSENREMVTVDSRYLPKYLDRLETEFEEGNLSLTLSQDSFHDESFTSQFMQRILSFDKQMSNDRDTYADRVRNLINKVDRTSMKSFLHLSTKSKSDKILKYICDHVELTKNELTHAVFGVCEHVSVASLNMLDRKYDLNMNIENMDSQTPLLVAATKRNEEMMKLILQRDAGGGAMDKNGNSALHAICKYGLDGEGEIVKILKEKGADVYMESYEYPYLPLSIACYEGQTKVVMALLSLGTDANKTNSVGVTPLHEASWMGHLDIVTLLLDGGAKVNKTNSHMYEGKTPLHDACRQGHLNVVRTLIEIGADVNKTSTKGVTPLHDACWNGQADVVRFLLENGAEINRTNGDAYQRKTPLHDACEKGYLDVVNVLLDGGVDFNKSNSQGETPLHNACSQGHFNVVVALIERGADVNNSSIYGVTPLHDSCWNGHADVAKLLLKNGAEVNKSNSDVYHRKTSLHDACIQGHFDVVTVLIDGGADVNNPNNEGETPLHYACRKGDLNIVNVLMSKGAGVNYASDSGVIPLHDACWNGHANIVRFLLAKGADINKTNTGIHQGKTPLHDACHQGHLDVVKVLLENGADVKKSDHDGCTPLEVAQKRGYDSIVEAF